MATISTPRAHGAFCMRHTPPPATLEGAAGGSLRVTWADDERPDRSSWQRRTEAKTWITAEVVTPPGSIPWCRVKSGLSREKRCLVPKGRDEGPCGPFWVRRRDES